MFMWTLIFGALSFLSRLMYVFAWSPVFVARPGRQTWCPRSGPDFVQFWLPRRAAGFESTRSSPQLIVGPRPWPLGQSDTHAMFDQISILIKWYLLFNREPGSPSYNTGAGTSN